MDDDTVVGFFAGLLILILILITWGAAIAPLLISIRGDTIEELRKEAVERGAATWVVDAETGDTQFTWNRVKESTNESK